MVRVQDVHSSVRGREGHSSLVMDAPAQSVRPVLKHCVLANTYQNLQGTGPKVEETELLSLVGYFSTPPQGTLLNNAVLVFISRSS